MIPNAPIPSRRGLEEKLAKLREQHAEMERRTAKVTRAAYRLAYAGALLALAFLYCLFCQNRMVLTAALFVLTLFVVAISMSVVVVARYMTPPFKPSKGTPS